jgi:cytochrome b561
MSSGALMLICAALIALTLRKKQWWLKVHKLSGITALILISTGLTALLFKPEGSTQSLILNIHAVIGFLVISFAVFQAATGILIIKLRKKRLRPIHIWAGRIAMISAPVNASIGAFMVGVF